MSTANARFQSLFSAPLLALVALFAANAWGCNRGEPLTPEQKVEASLEGMAEGARNGEADAVMDFVHADYTDDELGSKFVFGRMVMQRLGEGVGVSYNIVELTVQPDETVSAVVEANFRGADGRSGPVTVHTRWLPDGDTYLLASSQVDRNDWQ